MSAVTGSRTAPAKPPRLKTGLTLLVLQWLVRFGLPVVAPDLAPIGFLGGVAIGLLIVLWWLFFSRVPHRERWGALAVAVAIAAAVRLVLHPSVLNGMMGFFYPMYAVPGICLALVLWAALSRGMAPAPRWAALAAAMLVVCGVWALVRIEGITGTAGAQFRARWTPTAEERLLARAGGAPPGEPAPIAVVPAPAPAPATATATATAGEAPDGWTGFRGGDRDGVARRAARIATDWEASPPEELWRRPVGPGWSSFSGDLGVVCTQEQRGEEELVSCYATATGAPVRSHADTTRFWEANAGAGPRATPTLDGDRMYALGATGILNALDARDASVVWSRDIGADSGVETPYWGFSGSPLVVGDLVVAAASGTLLAYDAETGTPRWTGPDAGGGYSSPHAATIDGVPQIVLLGADGAIGVDPADGKPLWRLDWPSGDRIVQPAFTEDGDLLVAGGANDGLRRVRVRRDGGAGDGGAGDGGAGDGGGWTVETVWETRGLKPYFNDFVVHEGHAYGLDGGILACIDLADGARKWKGGRHGAGQLILLPAQDLLLVLGESGDVALVRAQPGGHEELARHPAIEGKTWNHPVLLGDVLLVRNDREMAAFRLAAGGS